MSLDKSKPYGIVYGQSTHVYEQNHKLYNADGEEVTTEGKQVIKKKIQDEVPTFGKSK